MEMIAKYCSEQSTRAVGKIDTLYWRWANEYGVSCDECIRLGQLFARAIDAAKSGEVIFIPSSLILAPISTHNDTITHEDTTIPSNNDDATSAIMVWNLLLKADQKFRLQQSQTKIDNNASSLHTSDISLDIIRNILSNNESRLREFQVFSLAVQYMEHHTLNNTNRTDFLREIIDQIDFGRFSIDEQLIASKYINRKIIINSLHKSHLLSNNDLNSLGLDNPLNNWRFWMRSSCTSIHWNYIVKAIRTFNNSLIIFNLGDGIVVTIRLYKKCINGEQETKNNIESYLFSHYFNYCIKYSVPYDYILKLNINEGKLEIYASKGGHFLWFGNEQFTSVNNSSKKTNTTASNSINNSVVDNGKLSVDLTRWKSDILRGDRPHPLVTKKEVIQMEIFIADNDERWNYFDSIFGLIDDCFDEEDYDHNCDVYDYSIESEPQEEVYIVWLSQLTAQTSEFEQDSTIDDTLLDDTLLLSNLHDSACNFNALQATSILTHFTSISLANQIASEITALIAGIRCNFGHLLVSDDRGNQAVAQEAFGILIEQFLPYIPHSDHSVITLLAIELCRLNMSNLALTILLLINPDTFTKSNCILEFCSEWSLWLCMEYSNSLVLVSHIFSQTYLARENTSQFYSEMNEDTTISTENNEIFRLAYMQVHAFLLELHSKTTMYSIDTLQHLKLDNICKSEKGEVIVSFYNSENTLKICNCEVGLWVNIFRMSPKFKIWCISYGQIVYMRVEPLHVSIRLEASDCMIPISMNDKNHYLWSISLNGNITLFIRVMKSLMIIHNNPKKAPLMAYIYSNKYQSSMVHVNTDTETTEFEVSKRPLNQSQMEAINGATIEPVSLVHGPPGTGIYLPMYTQTKMKLLYIIY